MFPVKLDSTSALATCRETTEGIWARLKEAPVQPWFTLGAVLVFLGVDASADATIGVLADAYWQVATYVAATLFVFYWMQLKLGDSSRIAKLVGASRRLQIVGSSLLGVLPGCGGAIVVVTQFVKGRVGFASVVTVVTATMGDAAFLLLAAEPKAGVVVLGVSLVAALVTGFVVDRLHSPDFLRPSCGSVVTVDSIGQGDGCEPVHLDGSGLFWMVLLVPSLVVALLGSAQVDLDAFFGVAGGVVSVVGAVLAVVSMLLWGVRSKREVNSRKVSEDEGGYRTLFGRVGRETSLVMCWVVCGFLAFELVMLGVGPNALSFFGEQPFVLIVMAIMVGWIPGCGPQIITTTLYLNGAIPLSAQMGNAISNDGDALFPALALAPRAAIVATVYTTIPAFVVAFGYALIFE